MVWYEDEIKRLEKEREELNNEPGLIFYGSSSIRLWETLQEDFKIYNPANLGFGGSTLAACVWFFERVIAPLQPDSIIVYAGDNDLSDGRHPEEVFIFFKQLVTLTRQNFGDIPLGFISIKPSISRWDIINNIKHTNRIIEQEINNDNGNLSFINVYDKMTDNSGYPRREFLEPDGLHINKKGYELWKDIILDYALCDKMKLF
ncbi:MAG: GDSL-type esterase/lipase family protein [Panacibacter sp.]